jgi:hypothetical protein
MALPRTLVLTCLAPRRFPPEIFPELSLPPVYEPKGHEIKKHETSRKVPGILQLLGKLGGWRVRVVGG